MASWSASRPSWSPTVVLVVLSVIAGVVMTVVFRYTSNQQGLKRVSSLTKAQLMCLRLFKEDLGVALRCQGDILKSIGRRLWLSLPPMAVLIIPFVLILTQLALRYEKRPIQPGESVVLAAELSPDQWQSHASELSLQVPDGVVLETPTGCVRSVRAGLAAGSSIVCCFRGSRALRATLRCDPSTFATRTGRHRSSASTCRGGAPSSSCRCWQRSSCAELAAMNAMWQPSMSEAAVRSRTATSRFATRRLR